MSFLPLTVTLAGQAILERNALSHLEQPPRRTPIRPLIRPGRADSAAILQAMKPFMLLRIEDILATFGAFLAVLIAIEIYTNITLYLT